jgi:hypothetical protein
VHLGLFWDCYTTQKVAIAIVIAKRRHEYIKRICMLCRFARMRVPPPVGPAWDLESLKSLFRSCFMPARLLPVSKSLELLPQTSRRSRIPQKCKASLILSAASRGKLRRPCFKALWHKWSSRKLLRSFQTMCFCASASCKSPLMSHALASKGCKKESLMRW